MVICWGTRNYGQTDYIPELHMYVTTQFFYLQFIPLVPVQSYIVLAENGDDFHGIPIGWHGKSVLLAWLRAAMLVGGVLGIIFGFIAMNEAKGGGPGVGVGLIALGLLGIGAMIGSCYIPYLGYASYETALEMAHQVGLNQDGFAVIEVAYGRAGLQQPQQQYYEQPQYQQPRLDQYGQSQPPNQEPFSFPQLNLTQPQYGQPHAVEDHDNPYRRM